MSTPPQCTVEILESVDELPESVWDALGTEVSHALSPRFWRVLEASDLQGFSYRYALLRDGNGAPVAFWGLYTVTTDIAIFAPRFLRTLLNRIRRYFPRFLIWNMLECGTPITIVSPPLAQRDDWELGPLVRQWTQTMAKEARRTRSLLIVLRDFEPNAWAYRPELARHGYHWIDGLPNTYLEIPWSDPESYRAAMRSYYRSKLLKHRRKVEAAGIRYELREDFADMAEELCAQWREVHEHAKEFQREVLTPAFYREFSRQMGPDSLVLLYYQNDTLLAHALLMRDGTMVRWLYVGRARAQNDGLYLYIAATVVETAIELGATRLEMGLTTYDVKLDLGAKAVPIAMGLRARWSWMNPFVGWGYRLLNSVPKPRARAVFKDSQATQGNAS